MTEPSTRDWRADLAFWLARTINPPVQPNRSIHFDLDKLRQLPDGTLGREVAIFLDRNQLSPPETGDWIQRTHDIWHVLTGLSPSPEDEFVLQAFVRAQVFRPSSAIIVLIGLLSGKLTLSKVRRTIQLGRVAQNIVNWDIESDWTTPLHDIRQRLGIQLWDISGES